MAERAYKLEWLLGLEKETLANMVLQQSKVIEKLQQAVKAQAVPEGWKLVPVEPTGEQLGGLARDIIFWLRSDSHQTPESLIEFLRNMGDEIPSWLTDEPEMKNANHVISKVTMAAIIYMAMLSAVPERPE